MRWPYRSSISAATLPARRGSIKQLASLTGYEPAVSFFMKTISKALLLALTAAGLCLTSCETLENRISEHPDIYNSLSPRDQTLVREGKIRSGMDMNAVWLAWGSPEQKMSGEM